MSANKWNEAYPASMDAAFLKEWTQKSVDLLGDGNGAEAMELLRKFPPRDYDLSNVPSPTMQELINLSVVAYGALREDVRDQQGIARVTLNSMLRLVS